MGRSGEIKPLSSEGTGETQAGGPGQVQGMSGHVGALSAVPMWLWDGENEVLPPLCE